MPRLILASSSPRRLQLLQQAKYDFDVIVPSIPEPDEALAGLSPSQQAESIAYFKARAVADQLVRDTRLILGADTIVALGRKVLGKPDDEKHAREMLASLSGTRHQVITGMALLGEGVRLLASDVTFVKMKPLSEADIDSYIRSGEWRGKAGAYAIQETADQYIEAIEGSYSNVVGLPLELLQRMLSELLRKQKAHKVS